MPLRDHFRPPLDDLTSWDGFLGGLPAMIVIDLNRKLPSRYVAGPRIRLGPMIDTEDDNVDGAESAFSPPTRVIPSDFPDQDECEVLIQDTKRGRRLVAAIEIVSPANKERPENRRIFAAKCAVLLQRDVSVAVVDLVTMRNFNLYGELLALIGLTDPALGAEPAVVHVSAVRCTSSTGSTLLEMWAHTFELGRPLPTLPLWLAENFCVPLELKGCYEESYRVLRIP